MQFYRVLYHMQGGLGKQRREKEKKKGLSNSTLAALFTFHLAVDLWYG